MLYFMWRYEIENITILCILILNKYTICFTDDIVSRRDHENKEENKAHGENVHKFFSNTMHSVRSVRHHYLLYLYNIYYNYAYKNVRILNIFIQNRTSFYS